MVGDGVRDAVGVNDGEGDVDGDGDGSGTHSIGTSATCVPGGQSWHV
jgi:hypothetical protein